MRPLKKTSASVFVAYSDGNFSNNLTGTDFELENSEANTICLSINLEGNLLVRNKSANCYSDACELAEDHASLRSVQIDDNQVIYGLLKASRKAPDARWKMRLLLGEKGVFHYFVQLEKSNGGVLLVVC